MTISLFIKGDRFSNREHFQSTTDSGSENGITTQALSDLMSEININNTLINSNDPLVLII